MLFRFVMQNKSMFSPGFPCDSEGEESASDAGDPSLVLAWEDPLEKSMATHSSILARRISGMGEPGGLLSLGSHGVGHD